MTDRLETVRALIAKAESTEYPDEAKAFLEKASELMARYAIDDAMLRSSGPVRDEKPTRKDLWILKPYAAAKVDLFAAVARHNGCRIVKSGGVRGAPGQRLYVFGFESAIHNSEMMHGALEIEGARELSAAIIAGHGIGEHGKTFTNSFLTAYAYEIAIRLRAAAARAKDQGTRTYGGGMALAIRDDAKAVDDAVSAAFGRLRSSQSRSVSSGSGGWSAGRSAGARASLSGNGLGSNSRNSLTR